VTESVPPGPARRATSEQRRLFPHQEQAATAICKVLADTGRTTGVLPCGTGKTRVGAEVAHRGTAGRGRRLVVVPTLELVHQTIREWIDHLGRPALGRIIAVCSDKEILSARRGAQAPLGDCAVTVDPARLAQLAAPDGPVTIACTYASLSVLAQAHTHYGLPPADVAVIDEAHRTAGAAGKAWAAIHYDHVIPVKRRLYLTATPRVVTGDDDDVISMSDEVLYGPAAYRMSFAQAIELDLLAPYRLVVPVVAGEQVRALTDRDDAFLRIGKAGVAASMVATQLAVLRAAHEHGIRRMITYHRSVQDAKWFTTLLPHAYALLSPEERPAALWTDCVHGRQSPGDRRRALERLAGHEAGLAVVSNARVLSEGVDVPAVDAVAFFNVRSTIDTIQATGRALRRAGPGKTASIIVPVIVDPDDDPEAALSTSTFAPLWQTVRALASHDETLARRLETARRALAEPGSRGEPADTVPDWLAVSGAPLPEAFVRAVSVRAVRTGTPSWPEYHRAAELYRAEHGNLLVPMAHCTPAGLKLGVWISRQRTRYAEGLLPHDQVEQLNRLDMVWRMTPEPSDYLRAAEEYYAEHGNLLVPKAYCTPAGVRLGRWIRDQRSRHAKGELPRSRVEQLDRLDMVWRVRVERAEYLRAAEQYRAKHGDLLVPVSYCTPAGLKLGRWISQQRMRYAHGQLPSDVVRQLNNLDMIWTQADPFLDAAEQYRAEYGDLLVRRAYCTPTGLELGRWIAEQRTRYSNGEMPPRRIQHLNSLGMIWSQADYRFELLFAEIRAFKKRYGHLRIAKGYVAQCRDGSTYKLGQMTALLRIAHGRGEVDPARVQRLNAEGFIWDARKYRWDERITALKEFKAQHGHVRVPKTYQTQPPAALPLGKWLDKCVRRHRNRKLPPDQAEALRGLGVALPAPPTDQDSTDPPHMSRESTRQATPVSRTQQNTEGELVGTARQ
jgi:superfamily II DNA or RNA helicase